MAECLVIGANGFLGSHLVDELVARGHTVTAFDRYSSAGVQHVAPGVRVIAGDFTNPGDLAGALEGHRYVFHLVSATTPFSAHEDPTLDVRTNLAPSIDLFQLCVRAGVECVYFASTGGAIYGDQTANATELSLPRPMSPYAIGKLAIEHYLGYFERRHGLRSVVLRVSNPYGPRQRSGKLQGVIPIFLRKIRDDLPLTVYGDGTAIRDYIFVTDAAAMMAETVGRDTAWPLYNVGSGEGTSVNELLAVVSEITGRAPIIERAPVPSTFVDHIVLDVSRHRGEFGASGQVPLVEGVARTWQAILAEQA